MLELAKNIIQLTNSKSKLVYLPLPSDDPLQRQPDISLAKEKLGGWKPIVPLKQGLVKTIKYFDKLLTTGKID
jgi:UDP-glucuronate decarboxylase